MICLPLSAVAADADYYEGLNEFGLFIDNLIDWASEQSFDSPFDSYIGRYGYYSDLENGFFYLRISYNESSLTDGENFVFMNFNIKNSSREYQFNVDENGFIHSGDSIEKSFEVFPEFGIASPQGHELYVGLKFLNKRDRELNTQVRFSIGVNGSTYHLCDGLLLEYEALTTTKPSTTKNQTTTKEPQSEKTTEKKESTTKFKYNGSGVTTSGKFTYNGNGYDESFSEYEDNYAEYYAGEQDIQSGVIVLDTGISSSLSPTAKMLYAAAIALAVSGAVIIVYNASKHKEEQKESNED